MVLEHGSASLCYVHQVMTKIGEIKTQGFILRVTRAQEADIILKLITKSGEKISAFAKAGLKSRKRFGGALEPLINIDFRATKRENQDLYYLEETQIRHDFSGLKKDIERITAASYLAELTEHSSQEGLEIPEIYNLFGAGLRALEAGLPLTGVLRQFEVKLLSILGWLPGFVRCAECGTTGVDLTLNADQGIATCRDCGIYSVSIDREVQEILRQLLQTSITKGEVEDADAIKIERVTATLLAAHWGNQKLKSVQFLGSLRRFQK